MLNLGLNVFNIYNKDTRTKINVNFFLLSLYCYLWAHSEHSQPVQSQKWKCQNNVWNTEEEVRIKSVESVFISNVKTIPRVCVANFEQVNAGWVQYINFVFLLITLNMVIFREFETHSNLGKNFFPTLSRSQTFWLWLSLHYQHSKLRFEKL